MHHIRYSVFAMILAVILIIFGELIWVADPIRISGWYWIDILQWLIYLCIAVPLLWLMSAFHFILKLFRRPNTLISPYARWMQFVLLLPSVLLVLCSLTAIWFIIVDPRRIVELGVSLAAAWLLAVIHIVIEELFLKRKAPWKGITIFVTSIVTLGLLLYPTSYLVTYPGITMNMHRYAQAEGGKPQGSISGVLVFERPAFPIDWLYAAVFPHYSFEKKEKLGMSIEDYNQYVRVLKADANTTGSAIAFYSLGLGQGIISDGVQIIAVTAQSKAADALLPGDVIIGVGQQTIASSKQLQQWMEQMAPGQEIIVEVLRGGKHISIPIETASHPEDPSRAILGIQITDHLQYDLPVPVLFRPYLLHEGGPSHGAMLALTLIDQLTPGGITNGHQVAGTGTIESDGSIGRIGSIRQKAFTVARSGATVFFVPKGQEEEARIGADAEKLQIVPVETLQDILDWLSRHPLK